ncbi:MAG: hypothetical protein KC731_39690, partial [Myxococcales bacterium]|nr:hypothetical protein [Myxococcales bacterium]
MLKLKSHSRRRFLQMAGGGAAVMCGLAGCKPDKGKELVDGEGAKLKGAAKGKAELTAQCPYCGVGCATLIQVDDGKIVGMVPDQISPVNEGVQCIKGLAAWEPTYTDRLTACLVRKDMSDPLTGHVSATKGKFSPDVWREVTYEEASKIAAEKIAAIAQKFGGNSVGLYGSGQLTLEGQYLENKFM